MLGAVVGDVIGSVYEIGPIKSTSFPLFHPLSHFTDDTVLTVAVASSILDDRPFELAYRELASRYPRAGYGASFARWVRAADAGPYFSYGNGAAMRVSPVGLAYDNVQDVLRHAERSAVVTHNHPEGVKGAQAVALAVFRGRTGGTKDDIRTEIESRFGYDLSRTVDGIRDGYAFDVTCQGSVPEALLAFLECHDVEHAIRLAVSLGGDSDTQAAIAGGVAHAFYRGIAGHIVQEVRDRLPAEFLDVLDRFEDSYPLR